ncbi:Rz1-like lysis system protein LysC [Pantoea stewartii]|uniref:Rz1-like lysis system protein LysC n=1 Tax=Pantoea stewartii TaxID=66269 RepID=UPI00092F46E0|nr:Rz1-like lysis system protein LysC [Pantoea stewartii]
MLGFQLFARLLLPASTAIPLSTIPQFIWPAVPRDPCSPHPENRLQTQGDLAADNRQLEAALASCGLQVEMIKACQEQHDVESNPTPSGADKQRSAATAKS